LDNVLSVEAFASSLKGQESILLYEAFPGPDELLAQGPEGSFTHELVVPFLRTSPRPAPPARARVSSRAPRSFAPGSEWLYAKFYTGTVTADEVLCQVVRPV